MQFLITYLTSDCRSKVTGCVRKDGSDIKTTVVPTQLSRVASWLTNAADEGGLNLILCVTN